MSSTRRGGPPLEIYQDPTTPFDYYTFPTGSQESQYSSAGDIQGLHTSHYENPLGPPPMGHARWLQSPLKQAQPPPARVLMNSNVNSVSIPPPQGHNINEPPRKKQPPMASFPPPFHARQQKALFTTFPSSSDKENMYSMYSEAIQSSDPVAVEKTLGKRSLMDAGLAKNSNKKVRLEDDESFEVPEPEDMPPVEDPGIKPTYSYATLIGMAILRAPGRKLTLAAIYKWISETFSYYQMKDTGWQNSIRHNLSLNKAFVKKTRSKDEPGKGSYWTIVPGSEKPFLKFMKDRPRRNTASEGSDLLPVGLGLRSDSVRPSSAPSGRAPTLAPPAAIDSAKFPKETDLSSDATIPDPDLEEQEAELPGKGDMPPPARVIPSSPPADLDLRSSPPLARAAIITKKTPPPVPRFPSTSRSGGRKRKYANMNDSGYYSSIESSVTRAHVFPHALTSEAGNSIKRGRAEDEIARIRGSSYDSPIKKRRTVSDVSSAAFPTSSPFAHDAKTGLSLGPLTPGHVFKRPQKPPASVSPNTNLKNHRKFVKGLLGSPDKGVTLLEEQLWSPAFKIETEAHLLWGDDGLAPYTFEATATMIDPFTSGSPVKRSVKRPSFERASTSATILADITGTSQRTSLTGPTSAARGALTPATPSQRRTRLESPLHLWQSNHHSVDDLPINGLPYDSPSVGNIFFGVDFHSDGSEETGLDLMQGFQKIGASQPNVAGPSNGSPSKPARPGMGRSHTSLF